MEFRVLLAAVAFAPDPLGLVPGKTLAGRHLRHKVHAFEAGPGAGFFFQRVEIEFAGRVVRDHSVGHPLLADQRGQRAGVDAGEPDNAARLQPVVEVLGGAIVRGRGNGGMQNDAAGPGPRRHVHALDVFLVGADIADMREGEGDDLPGIRRVGEDLLIAGHRGVEADLAGGGAGGAEAEAFQDRAVRQYQNRRRLGLVPGIRRSSGGGRFGLGHGLLVAYYRKRSKGPIHAAPS